MKLLGKESVIQSQTVS